MVIGLGPEVTLALLGPFAAMTTAGVTFFMGHQNGATEVTQKINEYSEKVKREEKEKGE